MGEVRGRVAMIGMFDGVHLGHRYLIDYARGLGDEKPLVFTFSNHPLSVICPEKSQKLLTTAAEKTSLLTSAGAEPVVLTFDQTLRRLTSNQFIYLLKSDYGVDKLLIGYNNRFGSDIHSTFDDYKAMGEKSGVEIIKASRYPGEDVSSSIIRRLIDKGDIKEANRLLNSSFTLTGTVVKGHQLGRTIGFPTANLAIDPAKIIPLNGVYAAEGLTADGKVFNTVVNIGYRPTVDDSDRLTIEAYLDRFEGNLYDSPLSLKFITRLRDEQRFTDLASLRAQITCDLAFFD